MPAARKKKPSTRKNIQEEPIPTSGGLVTEFIDSIEDLPTVYSNNVSFRGTSDDLRLDFGEILERVEDTLQVRRRVRIYLTWSHAARVASVFQQQLKLYEERINKPMEDAKPPGPDDGTT